MQNANGHFVNLSRGKVHYQFLNGDAKKPLVLCIHGINAKSAVWNDFSQKCNKYGYPILSPDLYGRGLSEDAGIKNNIQLFISQIEELIIHIYRRHSIISPPFGVGL